MTSTQSFVYRRGDLPPSPRQLDALPQEITAFQASINTFIEATHYLASTIDELEICQRVIFHQVTFS